jgi:hypothetical protein
MSVVDNMHTVTRDGGPATDLASTEDAKSMLQVRRRKNMYAL